MRQILVRVCMLALMGFGIEAAWGQATDGDIRGTVEDPSGSLIPGALVKLENVATGVIYSAAADESGAYRFHNVAYGSYRLRATASGFTGVTLNNVAVELNQSTTANLVLRIQSMTTQVEVTDAPALIDTTTAQIASSFQARQVDDLPQGSAPMGVLNLSLLGAGVASSGGLGVGDGPSVGGQRPRHNNFTIEGVDNNRKDVTGRNVSVPSEAVAQMTVLQNQFSAEFGHSSGGQFNVILKGGTNSFHGSVYEYLQNRKLNAVDASLARTGERSNRRYDSNLIGGSAGGPIVRNKLFYFADVEYNPIGRATAGSAATLAPTAGGYRQLAAIAGLSATNLNVLQQYLGAAPAASGSTSVRGVNIPIGGLFIGTPSYQNTHNTLASVDYTLSERDQARARYVDNRTAGLDPETAPNLPAFNQNRNTASLLGSLSEFHSFSPRVTNELRLAYNRYNDKIPSGNFQFPGLDVFPTILIEQDLNAQLGPFSQAPQATVVNTYQLVDNVNYTRGRHAFKFGFDARKYIAPVDFVQKSRGEYGYSNLERYLLDLNPDIAADRNTGGTPFSGNQVSASGFANDEFRVGRNLTMDAGIRYEYKGMAEGLKLQALNSLSSVPGLIAFDAPKAPRTDFAPRVGLAWSPGRGGNTAVRAGFGMAYDSWFDNLGANAMPPQLQTTASADIRQSVPGFLAGGGIGANAAPATLTVAQARALTAAYLPTQLPPYAIQWNIGVQRVFKNDYTVEVRYLGTRGVHLINQTRLNMQSVVGPTVFLPTFLQRPSQGELDALRYALEDLKTQSFFLPQYEAAGFSSPITSYVPRGNSIYHGLAAEVTRRFARGLLFKGAYTWSHNIDDSTADVASTLLSPRRPQDFDSMRPERASSMLDRRQRFTMSGVWDLPWFRHSGGWFAHRVLGGFTIAGTYTAESPEYATVQSGIDANLNGDSVSDRAIINLAGEADRSSDTMPLKNNSGKTVAYLAMDPTARYLKARAGAYPTGGRNTLPLAGINNFDLSLMKRLPVRERATVEFRAMLYNAANHPQFTPGSINTVVAVPRPATRNNLIPGNPSFNDPSSVYESNARTAILAVRVTF